MLFRSRSSDAKVMPVLVLLFLLFFCDQKYRPRGRYYRWELPVALPLMKIRFWNAPEVAPELPVNRKYRRAQRYYRWLLPEPLPEPVPLTKMGFCIFSGSYTGSDTGTTAKPEVPALPAELPLLRVRFPLPEYRWGGCLT